MFSSRRFDGLTTRSPFLFHFFSNLFLLADDVSTFFH
jgi:hypothetical protein